MSNTSRAGDVVGLDAFTRDLNGKNLPQYAFISPNIDNDGHDTGLAYGASWLRKFLTPLLQNSYFMDRTLVLLTYDESETYSQPNKIGAILLGGPFRTISRVAEMILSTRIIPSCQPSKITGVYQILAATMLVRMSSRSSRTNQAITTKTSTVQGSVSIKVIRVH